jgi:hypothetical protein
MNEEYVWKEATGKLAIRDFKPNHNVTFHNQDGKQVGELNFNGPEMVFTGDADESAKIFFDLIAGWFKERLDQERADERKAIYDLVMEAPFNEFDRQEEDFDGEAANAMKAMAFSLTAAIRARGSNT